MLTEKKCYFCEHTTTSNIPGQPQVCLHCGADFDLEPCVSSEMLTERLAVIGQILAAAAELPDDVLLQPGERPPVKERILDSVSHLLKVASIEAQMVKLQRRG